MTSTLLSPMVDYYNDEEDLDSVDDDDDRSFRGRGSEEGNVMNLLTKKVGSVHLLEKGRKRAFLYTLNEKSNKQTDYSLRGVSMLFTCLFFVLFERKTLI